MAVACHHGGLESSVLRTAKALCTPTGMEKDSCDRDIALCNDKQLTEAAKWLKQILPGALKRPNSLPTPSAKAEAENLKKLLEAEGAKIELK